VIRHRLVAAIVAAVTVVMAVTGVVVLTVLENRLVASADEQLTDLLESVPLAAGASDPTEHLATSADRGAPPHAVVAVGPDGKIRAQVPSGPADDPAPLPDITGLTVASVPVTLPAVRDGELEYRAIGISQVGGGMLIAAIPLTDVESTLAETRQILLVAGTVALAITAALVWLSIRRGLRPIDDMIDAARRIADGDLTARTTAPRPATEVGQLGAALNTMLERIAAAMAAQAESESRMRRFVADASHELRTPLTSIRGYAELHRHGATSPEEVTRGMARIEHEAQHMAALVDDLLLLARLDQGRPLANDPVDLAQVVREAAGNARATDTERTIVLDLPNRPAIVRGDRQRLRQVLDNLLANVRDHTDPGTVATITLADHDGTLTLTVADDGPGMNPNEAARAFDRFWQAEPTTTRSARGTGLGLAITAELVAAQHGTITLDTIPGQGSAFTITLPTAGTQHDAHGRQV
jgi:two-component system, OmpR family, sensor kinase